MSREVRRVPADWKHPTDQHGCYIPLSDGYQEDYAHWQYGYQKWQEGFVEDFVTGKLLPIPPEYQGESYEDLYDACPVPEDYMPTWAEGEATHFMMYETFGNGTPMSPAFATREELAMWLTTTNASAFGYEVASYEGWLAMINKGSAASLAFHNGEMISGVQAISSLKP
jgi:hypothetical protein